MDLEVMFMKILSIGNSFSQDATRYLHRMAKSCDIDLKVVNLYIGGCSLKTHYYNMLENEKAYWFEFNGESTKIKVTIKEALMSDDWDYVTLQQVSSSSDKYDTYMPYMEELEKYIKKYLPSVKILIHQTWAYEDGFDRLHNEMGYETAADMFENIEKSYKKAAKHINADGVIPCGKVIKTALENGIKKIHRDGFHASLGIGRYALALTWLAYLCCVEPGEVSFNDLDEPASEEEILAVKKAVEVVLKA